MLFAGGIGIWKVHGKTNLNDDSQRANHLSYCCMYDTDVLLRLGYLAASVTRRSDY